MSETLNASHSNLYVLFFPEKSVIKIGKANKVLKRCAELSWLGKPDLKNSYQIPMPKKRVFEMESVFHLLFKESRLNVGSGSGYTEIFSVDCLPKVVEYLKVFSDNPSLKAGIKELPKLQCIDVSIREKERERLARFDEDLIQIKTLISRLSKVVQIFVANSDSIPYQVISEPSRSILFKSDYWPIVKRLIRICQPDGQGVRLHAHLDGLHLNILPHISVNEPGLVQIDIFSEPITSNQEKRSNLLIPLELIWSELNKLTPVSPMLKKPLRSLI